jgi:cytochrome c-type biogenesis protein CcmH
MIRRPALGLAMALTIAALPALAVQPDERLADPALEARARAISTELRCMVCQNQSIDDSDAGLARDLRVLVRERLVLGESNSEVLDYLVDRYGEYVLLKPRFEWHTLALWLAGPVLLVGGLVGAFLAHRRQRREGTDVRLTDAEEARLKALLGGDEGR